MLDRVKSGCWCWMAPLGYVSARTPEGEPTLSVDPESGSIIRRAFERIASGVVSQRDAWRSACAEGLRSRSGKPIPYSTFSAMLRKDVYRGVIVSEMTVNPVLGNWEALVSPEIFAQVHQVLSGSSQIGKPKRTGESFPLKGFARCAQCGRPLTGYFSRGRAGRHGYYGCPSGCSKQLFPHERLHQVFIELVDGYRPDSDSVRLFRASLEQHFRESQAKNRQNFLKGKKTGGFPLRVSIHFLFGFFVILLECNRQFPEHRYPQTRGPRFEYRS